MYITEERKTGQAFNPNMEYKQRRLCIFGNLLQNLIMDILKMFFFAIRKIYKNEILRIFVHLLKVFSYL